MNDSSNATADSWWQVAAVASAIAEASEGLSLLKRVLLVIGAMLELAQVAQHLLVDILMASAMRHPWIASCILVSPLFWLAYRYANARAIAMWKKPMRNANAFPLTITTDAVTKSSSSPDLLADYGFEDDADDPGDIANDVKDIGANLKSLPPKSPRIPSALWRETRVESDALGVDFDAPTRKVSGERSPSALHRTIMGERKMPRPFGTCHLAPCSVLADLGNECWSFLEERVEIKTLKPGESLFERNAPRLHFFLVKSGQVVVRPSHDDGHEYNLGPGDTVVGLLFVLASAAGQSGQSGASGCSDPFRMGRHSLLNHSSSARAANGGAEVVALPTTALADAFDRFGTEMLAMTKLLCTRLVHVVIATLSTYFGIKNEVFKSTSILHSYIAAQKEDNEASGLKPSAIFARLLDCQGEEKDNEKHNAVANALDSATELDMVADQIVLPLRQRSPHMLVLLEGTMQAEYSPGNICSDSVSSETLGPGTVLGELSIFIEGPSPINYRTCSPCRFAALPREAVQELIRLEPRKCLSILHVVASSTAGWLHRMDAALDWMHLKGGNCLYRRGDKMHGFFVVLSGRLLAVEESPGQRKEALHIRRGRLCGELDCLRNLPYSHTVKAIRDSEVCRISPIALDVVTSEFPRGMLHFSAQIAHGAGGNAKDIQEKAGNMRKKDITTIAIVPATEHVKVDAVCSSLLDALSAIDKTAHVTSDMMKLLPPRKLAEMEESHQWLIYEAEAKVSEWTKCCVRQADLILVVTIFDGSGSGDVPQSPVEEYLTAKRNVLPHVDRHFLMLYPGDINDVVTTDTLRPGLRGLIEWHGKRLTGFVGGVGRRSARHYLRTRPWAGHWHHVRADEPGDYARVARLLVGCGIGLCLGGGGARGCLHLGAIKAMEELNIPIDAVAGTSFGALAGGVYCMSAATPGSLEKVWNHSMSTSFSRRRLMYDVTFPRTSYFTGAFLNFMLQNIFARRRCEDLLIPFACTSTDILHFEAKVHREGPLWRIIRASMTLVGLVPPIPHKELQPDGKVCKRLLVDGGYTNQWPVETLQEFGCSSVICIIVSPEFDAVKTDYGDAVSGTTTALKRKCSCKRRSATDDPPALDEIQERLMFLVDAMKEGSAESNTRARADLILQPSIEGYGLLDFHKYIEMGKAGYEYAKPELQTWLQGDSAAASWVKSVIEARRSMEEVQLGARSKNLKYEYGGRDQYASVRAAATETVKSARKKIARAYTHSRTFTN